jgi:hypothetical protein
MPDEESSALAAVLTPGVWHEIERKNHMIAVEETAMEGFLFFSGSLAIIVGLIAVIEGNLGCIGNMRHKKG